VFGAREGLTWERRTNIARNGDQTKASTTAASRIFTGSGQPPWLPGAAGSGATGSGDAAVGAAAVGLAASNWRSENGTGNPTTAPMMILEVQPGLAWQRGRC
jgi:hypothetical protein